MRIINQSGFAVVQTLLIVVILALIGGTGYYVWRSRQAVNISFSDSHKVASQSSSKSQPKEPTTQDLIRKSKQASDLTEKTYATYIQVLQKYNNRWEALAAVKSNLSDDLYVTLANDQRNYDPVLCSQQVPAHLEAESVTPTNTMVAVSLGNGTRGGANDYPLIVNVNVMQLKITKITCPTYTPVD